MSIVSEIIARLKDPELVPEEGAALFRVVDGAADLAALKGIPPKAVPAAFVYIGEEEAEANSRMNGPSRQLVHAGIAVLIIARNLSDAHGAAALGDLEVLKAEVRRRLIGWKPASAEAAIEADGGGVTSFAGGAVWWEERLTTDFFIEEQAA